MKKAAPGRAGCPAPEQSSGGDIWITAVPLLSRCQTSFSFGKVKQFQAFPSRPAPHRLRWHPSAGPAPRWGGVPAPPPERHPQRPAAPPQLLPRLAAAARGHTQLWGWQPPRPLPCHRCLWVPTAISVCPPPSPAWGLCSDCSSFSGHTAPKAAL